MNKKLICLLAFVFSLCMGFTACGDDDDDPVNLTLEKAEVTVDVGKTVEVKITQGNGGYIVTPTSTAIATAVEKDKVVTITGVAAGETVVTVKDKEGKSAPIKVTVTAVPEPGTDYALEIEGTYDGILSIALGEGEADPFEGKEVEIIRTADNKIELLLANFSYDVLQLGDIRISDVVLTEENGTVKLAETKVEDVELGGGMIKASISLFPSTVTDGNLLLTIKVGDIMLDGDPLGMDVNVDFDGNIVTPPTEE